MLHIAFVLKDRHQDTFPPFLRHCQGHVELLHQNPRTLSTRHFHTCTGMSSGPTAFPIIILFKHILSSSIRSGKVEKIDMWKYSFFFHNNSGDNASIIINFYVSPDGDRVKSYPFLKKKTTGCTKVHWEHPKHKAMPRVVRKLCYRQLFVIFTMLSWRLSKLSDQCNLTNGSWIIH